MENEDVRTGCPEEQTLQDLLRGKLTDAALADVERHLSSCSLCSRLVAEAAQFVGSEAPRASGSPSTAQVSAWASSRTAPDRTLARGLVVGRYLVLDLIGRGGMGEVYLAYDSDLERKVAIKVVRQDFAMRAGGREAAGRLRREAKAVAKLSHPNVVGVYEVGFLDDRIFIAMEYVEGQTVAGWLRGAPRSVGEILPVFIAAGQGLKAAHDAGIIHRDFKPQNVMIDGAGRVRVMDFGMATLEQGPAAASVHQTAPDQSGLVDDAATAPVLEATRLTRTGALLGTPAYMAPEQFRGGPVDARSDQYSFCVALYEALHGARPPGGRRGEPGAAKGGNVRDAAITRRPGPTRLRALLMRGLQEDPNARFPSMDALLAALERIPVRGRRARLLGLASVGFAVLAGAIMWGRGPSPARLCRGGSARVATVWEHVPAAGSRRSAVERAFLAAGLPQAADIFSRTARLLDRYAEGWVAMHTDACAATHERGEQSAALLDLRMTCLRQKLGDLRALTDLFAAADRKVVENAVDAALGLPTLDSCADSKALQSVILPPDPAVRARVERVRQSLSEAKARRDARRFSEAAQITRPLVEEAHRIGYGPLQADVLLELALEEALADGTLGDERHVELALRRALVQGMASGQDEVVATAAVLLVAIAGTRAGKHDEAQRWDELAEAALRRIGGHDRLWAWLLNHRLGLFLNEGRFPEALAAGQRSVELIQKALGPDHPEVAISLGDLGVALNEAGQSEEAVRSIDRAIRILDRAYGPDNRNTFDELVNRGEALVALGRYAEARADFRRSFAGLVAGLGSDHPSLAFPLTGLGLAFLEDGQAREAVPSLERALKFRTENVCPIGRREDTQFALARALWDAGGDRRRARRLAGLASEGYARVAGLAPRRARVDLWLAQHQLTGPRRPPMSNP